MATAATTGPSTGCTLRNVNDNQKRWMVFGLALKVLVDQIRSLVAQEIQRQYGNLKASHGIDTQSASGRLKNWPTVLKYENINGNDAIPKVKGKHNYSAFDCRVTSHVDFARLYLENHMAKFTAFDEHCDASAVLNLLSKVPVFSVAVQSAAVNVRQARNAWAHCTFIDWNPVKFHQCFIEMEQLVKSLGLLPADENNFLTDLKEWESKGTLLCMNITMDPALLQLVQQHVNALKADVDKLVFEVESDREAVKKALQDVAADLIELEKRVSSIEQENTGFKRSIQSLHDEQSVMKTDHEFVQQRVTQVEEQLNSAIPQITFEIANCEADITFFADRYDPDTRQWLFEDFDKWFNDPGDSRAYVLLGDAGVGKSVMAGALAQHEKNAGDLGAAYFCRHNDGTRNDPRYLLGTVAYQLCKCSIQYSNIVGGEGGVRMMLANSKLKVQELFTKLLEEPLSRCSPCQQRILVIIDALDETEYESREDFICLIQERFPRLPEWLVFFITSRPEDTIQSRLERYNPCVRICAGNSEQHSFYQQHVRDIQRFLEKRVDFPHFQFSLEDLTKECNGLFLYAFYIVKELNDPVHSGRFDQISNPFLGNIDDFFRKNFQRVFNKVGADLYQKLFGCMITAPSPLPVSCLSFVLNRESSDLNEQEVIDAVSQFVVLRTSDQTVTFLHNLIPTWLSNKRKARKLFIDKKTAAEYLTKIFIETLTAVIDEAPPSLPSIDEDFHDFVLHAAVRFLCQNGDKGSLEVVFSYVTSYRFMEKRIRSGRIEIYHLLEDLKLAADCLTVEEAQKQNILQEISLALETDVHVLLECPHLLRSCIRNASNVVQKSILVPQVSVPWMEWNICDISAVEILSECDCFATAFDKKTVAVAKGLSLSFVDLSTLQTLNGPFELNQDTIKKISHLEFSTDDKFVFFGRLDKWFSVERGCVEDIPQFIEKTFDYEWVLLTSDGQSAVVEKDCLFDFPQSCRMQFCITELLALWAMKEIDQSQDDQMTCTFSWSKRMIAKIKTTRKGQVARLLKFLQIDPTLHQIHVRSLLNDPSCYYCGRLKELTESNQESSLATVRQLIIELYPRIFRHQVWNVRTGRPLLYDIFCLGAQFNSFTYFCHVTSAFDQWGMSMRCSGVDKALSVCNIAVVNAIYAFLKMVPKWNLEELRERKQIQEQTLALKVQKRRLGLEDIQQQKLRLDLEEVQQQKLRLELEEILEQERELIEGLELKLEQIPEHELELKLKQIQEQKRRLVLELGLKQIQIQIWGLNLKLTQNPERRLVMELGLEQIQIHIQELKLEQMLKQIQEQEGRLDIELWLEQRKIQIKELKLKLKQHVGRVDIGQELAQIQTQIRELKLELKLIQEQERRLDVVLELKLMQEQEQELKLKLEQIPELKLKLEQIQEQERTLEMDPELEQIQEQKLKLKQTQEQERRLKMELEMDGELEQKFLWRWDRQWWQREWKWDIQLRKWEHIQLRKWERKLDLHVGLELFYDSFKYGRFINFPKGFLDLVWTGIPLWVSPEKKCVAVLENIQKIHFLQTKIQEEEFCNDNSGKQEHGIARVVDFTFTTDDLYVVYLSEDDSLHALSLQTGTVFTSVSGTILFYFTEEKQTGYLFRSGTDERAIFLTNLYSRFKGWRFRMRPNLGKSVTAIFSSSNTVKFVTSDLMVTLWNTTNLKRGISFKFISNSCLAASRSHVFHVKKCVPSPDGKLVVIQQETKIDLYSVAQSERFHFTVFEADFGFTVVCLTFSADGTFLLFCVQDNFNEPHFYVWDVRKKATSVSFKSPGLLAVECFCLSSDKRNLVLCGEYEIEVWEYDTLPVRLLKKSGVERFYNTVNFSHCTVSLDNELLVCCIANVIFIYNLHVADFHSSKRVLRGHLGKIEFCKFLKANRYLISYGVDGMVFLWDIIESKAAGFARVAQGQENIFSMAVSPEEDRVICFLSSDRVSVINLCKLECALSSELLTAPTKGRVNTAETSLPLAGRIASTSNIPTSSVEDYTAEAFRSPDLEERFLLTPDDLLDSDESDHSWSD